MFLNLVRFLLVIILLSSPVSAEVIAKDNFEVDFDYGFNKFYIEDSLVSAKVNIFNNHEDIEGKVELLVNVSTDEEKKVYSSYNEDLFLSKGSDKSFNINFFPSHDKALVLRILDKAGQVVWSSNFELEEATDSSHVNIAVLSRDFDKFSSLNSIPISEVSDINKVGYDTPYTHLVNLADSFPSDKHLLKSIDMIIIDNFNLETLDDIQLNALNSWVDDGNILVDDGSVDKDMILNLINKHIDLDNKSELNDYLVDSLTANTQDNESSIDFVNVLFVFLIFLLVFIIHFILKEINKLNIFWISMPLVSLFFLSFMYIRSPISNLADMAVNSVSVTQLSSDYDYGKTNSFIALNSSNGKEITVVSDKDKSIYLNDFKDSINFDNYEDGDIAVYNSLKFGSESEISFKDGFLKSEEESLLDIKTEDILINSQKISGKIINNSDIDLTDIVLFYGNSFFHVGDILKKSSKDLDIKLSDKNNFIFNSDIASQIYGDDTTKSMILRDEIVNFSNRNDVDLTLIAWSSDSFTKDLKVNDEEVKRIDKNLIFIPFADYISPESLNIPFGVLDAEVMEYPNMNIATYKPKRFSGSGHVVYSFIPWRSLDMDKFSLSEVSVSLGDKVSSGKVTPYFYNYRTLDWDEQSNDVLKVDHSNMDIYYDDEYGVKVSIKPSDRNILVEEPLVSANFIRK